MNKYISRSVVYLFLILIIVLFAFPIYWMIKTSIEPRIEILSFPPFFFPQNPILDNYILFFKPTRLGGGLVPMRNSLIVASVSTAITIFLSIFMAYGFARYKVGGDNLSFFVLTLRMMPPIVPVIPLFLVISWFGLLDNVLSLILIYPAFNIPFAVWLLMDFFRGIPKALEEAATIDGCSSLSAFLRITLPLAAPGIAVSAIFVFIFCWNEFLFALIMTRSFAKTLTVHLSGLHIISPHGIDWGPISATALIASIPVYALAMIISKYIVRGLTLGAVKG